MQKYFCLLQPIDDNFNTLSTTTRWLKTTTNWEPPEHEDWGLDPYLQKRFVTLPYMTSLLTGCCSGVSLAIAPVTTTRTPWQPGNISAKCEVRRFVTNKNFTISNSTS